MRLTSAFRVGSIVNVIAMLVQALFAGEILGGMSYGPALHLGMAKFLVIWGGLQATVALAMKTRHLAPPWLPIAAAGVFVAEVCEFGLGHFHSLILHVPLAVAIFGGAVRQFLWSLRMPAAAPIGRV
jgi:hypothetical protein